MSPGFKQLTIKLPPEETPCRFFGRGFCARGDACKFKHDPTDIKPKPGCVFFQRGACRNGKSCRFRHEASAATNTESSENRDDENGSASKSLPISNAQNSTGNITRCLYGAEVTFSAGARISSIQLGESAVVVNALNSPIVVCSWRRRSPIIEIEVSRKFPAEEVEEFLLDSDEFQNAAITVDRTSYGDSGGVRVRITHVRHDTSDFDILDVLGRSMDEKYILNIQGVGPRPNEKRDVNAIKQFFTREGHVTFLADNLALDAPTIKLSVQFERSQDMRSFIKKYHGKYISAIGSKLKVLQRHTVSHPVRVNVFVALQDDYSHLKTRITSRSRVMVRESSPDPIRGLRHITLAGHDTRQLMTAKGLIKELLDGVVAQDEDKILWHAYFAGREGVDFVRAVAASSDTYIYSDRANCCIRIYGSPSCRSQALVLLLAKIEELQDFRLTMVIRSPEYNFEDFNAMFRWLLNELGPQSVKMNRLADNLCHLVVRSMPNRMEEAQQYISHFRKRDRLSEVDSRICPICWCEPDVPLTLPCDHDYCTACFIKQCETLSEDPVVKCLSRKRSLETGQDTACNQPVTLSFLQSRVPAKTFEDLLQRAVASHVKQNPQSFKYCPTPGCEHLCAPSSLEVASVTEPQDPGATDQTVLFSCPNCLQTTCRICGTRSHPEFTCAEAIDIANGGEEAFNRWKTSKTNVKDCPKCSTTIEKMDGCNHVHCAHCKAHICWFCLESFDLSGTCYNHMEQQHGGLQDLAEESEDENMETEGEEDDSEDESED